METKEGTKATKGKLNQHEQAQLLRWSQSIGRLFYPGGGNSGSQDLNDKIVAVLSTYVGRVYVVPVAGLLPCHHVCRLIRVAANRGLSLLPAPPSGPGVIHPGFSAP